MKILILLLIFLTVALAAPVSSEESKLTNEEDCEKKLNEYDSCLAPVKNEFEEIEALDWRNIKEMKKLLKSMENINCRMVSTCSNVNNKHDRFESFKNILRDIYVHSEKCIELLNGGRQDCSQEDIIRIEKAILLRTKLEHMPGQPESQDGGAVTPEDEENSNNGSREEDTPTEKDGETVPAVSIPDGHLNVETTTDAPSQSDRKPLETSTQADQKNHITAKRIAPELETSRKPEVIKTVTDTSSQTTVEGDVANSTSESNEEATAPTASISGGHVNVETTFDVSSQSPVEEIFELSTQTGKEIPISGKTIAPTSVTNDIFESAESTTEVSSVSDTDKTTTTGKHSTGGVAEVVSTVQEKVRTTAAPENSTDIISDDKEDKRAHPPTPNTEEGDDKQVAKIDTDRNGDRTTRSAPHEEKVDSSTKPEHHRKGKETTRVRIEEEEKSSVHHEVDHTDFEKETMAPSEIRNKQKEEHPEQTKADSSDNVDGSQLFFPAFDDEEYTELATHSKDDDGSSTPETETLSEDHVDGLQLFFPALYGDEENTGSTDLSNQASAEGQLKPDSSDENENKESLNVYVFGTHSDEEPTKNSDNEGKNVYVSGIQSEEEEIATTNAGHPENPWLVKKESVSTGKPDGEDINVFASGTDSDENHAVNTGKPINEEPEGEASTPQNNRILSGGGEESTEIPVKPESIEEKPIDLELSIAETSTSRAVTVSEGFSRKLNEQTREPHNDTSEQPHIFRGSFNLEVFGNINNSISIFLAFFLPVLAMMVFT